MRILIIEPDKDLENKFSNFFTKHHYEIIFSNSTENAQALIELQASNNEKNKENNNDYDIVLFDLNVLIPLESNLNFLFFLQKHGQPFIFITDLKHSYNIINNLKPGPWSYLVKPILSFDAILVLIEQLCHREQLLTANKLYSSYIESEKSAISDKHRELAHDQELGKKIHEKFLPVNNNNKSDLLNFSYFLYPSLYISGDFVDFKQLDKRYTIFYLSDVSGHGVSSAFVTILVKAAISQYCSEYTQINNNKVINPEAMLLELNKLVCAENLDKYLTMAYFVYDAENKKITYSIAGHYPFPIYIESKTQAKFIGERGYPIGMFKEASFDNYYLDVKDNFNLALFSDGVMEIISQPNLDSKEQYLLDIFDNLSNFDIESVQNALDIHDLKNNLPDDVAGLLVSSKELS